MQQYLRNRFYVRGWTLLGVFNTLTACLFNRVLVLHKDKLTHRVVSWSIDKGSDHPPMLYRDEDDDEDAPGWLCECGHCHWQEDGLHCDCCGAKPPWGCDCGMCNDPVETEVDPFYDNDGDPDYGDLEEEDDDGSEV